MNLPKTQITLCALISLSLVLPAITIAAEGFIITPKLATSWQFETNYFRSEENEREVSTYLIQPGLELGFETPKSSLVLDYTLDVQYFDDRASVPPGQRSADDDDFLGHTAKLEARHRPFDRLLVGLDESFYRTREPADSDPFSNAVDRDRYYINRLTPAVIYEFGRKFSAALRYRYTVIDFDPEDREDATGHRGILDLIYSFTPRTSLDLEYQHWTRTYDLETSDFTADQIKMILRRKFRQLSISAGAGYQNRDFDDRSLDDIDVFAYHLYFENVGLLANRRTYVSLNVDQNFNDYGPNDEYFKATRITLRAGHALSRKLSADIDTSYQRSDYERTEGLTSSGKLETRKDDTFIVSGTIAYTLSRWLTLSLTAGYEQRNSNLAGFDYDNNFYRAELAFAYPVGRK